MNLQWKLSFEATKYIYHLYQALLYGQLNFDGLLDLNHILLRNHTQPLEQPFFADGCQLIRHGLAHFFLKDGEK
jgi:hypothetical protein